MCVCVGGGCRMVGGRGVGGVNTCGEGMWCFICK